MTDVPVISITLDETDERDDDDFSHGLCIDDCHTDVEDLESDQSRKNSLNDGIKGKGGGTEVEDFDGDSDDQDTASASNYGPDISLNEYLDQGSIDESNNLTGKHRNKLAAMRSVNKSPSPTAFNLNVTQQDYGGVTDCEDLEASGDDNEDDDKVYSDEDRAIVLEGENAIDVHDSVTDRKRSDKLAFAPKIVEPESSGLTSSESEYEKPKARFKAHKHLSRRAHTIGDAKSDTENIFFSDDDKRRRSRKTTPVPQTPDVEVMAFDGTDNDDEAEPPQYPEINISFVVEEKPKKKIKRRSIASASALLGLPENQDEGHTDVENLNSSDDDDEPSIRSRQKSLIPIAVIKSDALTDVEDFGEASEDDWGFDEKPDVVLPSPVRELTFLIENKTGEPMKQTTALPDNLLLGFHDLDTDKGLTDVEDFSDESDDDNENEVPVYTIDSIPDLDGGFVESSDHTSGSNRSPRPSMTPDPLTDCEDIFVKRHDKGSDSRRRRTKAHHSHHKPKSNFLGTNLYVDASSTGAHTDVEDLDVDDDDVLLKDRSLKHRRATVDRAARKASTSSIADGKTDIEYVSGDESIDLSVCTPEVNAVLCDFQIDTCTLTSFRDSIDRRPSASLELKLPEIIRTTPTSDSFSASTDIEDHQCHSDIEDAVSYSRAQTATPMQLSRDLEELSTSEIHEVNSRAFDRVRERFEIKDNLCFVDSHTDVENFDGDEN